MGFLATAAAMFLAGGAMPEAAAAQDSEPAAEMEIVHAESNPDQLMTVPVRIGESGTFRFLIDTGSQRTVLSTDLALQLGLAQGPNVRIIGIAGAETVGTAHVEEIGFGRRSFLSHPVLLM